MAAYEVRADGYLVSDDRARLDYGVIHGFLSTCYWSAGISLEQVRRQTQHSSLVFGLYREQAPMPTSSGDTPVAASHASRNAASPATSSAAADLDSRSQEVGQAPATGVSPLLEPNPGSLLQLGFARVISDLTRFAYVCDVFVVPEAQGQGLGKRLMRDIKAHPELVDVYRWLLATRDAHGLYAQYGFEPLRRPESWMSIHPDKTKPGRWK